MLGLKDVMEPYGVHPYYIVTPAYTERSAGIRVLHLLALALLRQGLPAFVVDRRLGALPEGPFAGPLSVPTLTAAIVRAHEHRGLTPIVIYPETVEGNPLTASCVVRYYLNFPGAFGHLHDFAPEEMRMAFGRVLAEATASELVLALPTSDPRAFAAPVEGPRTQVLAYAHKFRMGGGIPDLPPGATEITASWPPSRDLPGLLGRASVLHVWENTALTLEALLSGCPVVLRQPSGMGEHFLQHELGWAGVSRSAEPAAIEAARAELPLFRERYEALGAGAWVSIAQLVTRTQAMAGQARPSHINTRALKGHSNVMPVGSGLAAGYQRWLAVRRWLRDGYRRVR